MPGAELEAARNDPALRPGIVGRLRTLEAAVEALPRLHLDALAEADARAGRLVRVESELPVGTVIALLSARGALVAMAERREEGIKIRRGFLPPEVDG